MSSQVLIELKTQRTLHAIAMLAKAFSKGIGTTRKILAINILLVAGSFVWYFYAFDFLNQLAKPNTIWGPTFLGIAAAAIIGTFFIDKFKRRLSFIRIWMIAGILLSMVPMVVSAAPSSAIVVGSVLLGAYFGFGMPICMGYFAASVETEKRARSGGIIVLFLALGLFVFSYMPSQAILTTGILIVFRTVTLAALSILKPEEKNTFEKDKVSYRFVVSYKPFLFYLVPWIMFCLVNDLTFGLKEALYRSQDVFYSGIAANVLGGIFAVVGGFVADSDGRKKLAVAGFASMGIAYAVLGLGQGNLYAWYFYNAIDGICFGAFFTIFVTTIWGDLAQYRNAEKFYAIGSLPSLFSNFARLPLGSFVASRLIGTPSLVFSFASLFLFFGVVPLIFAPETLPEKIIKQRELEIYVEKAQEVAQKYY